MYRFTFRVKLHIYMRQVVSMLTDVHQVILPTKWFTTTIFLLHQQLLPLQHLLHHHNGYNQCETSYKKGPKTRWTFFGVKLVFAFDFEISWSLGLLILGTLGTLGPLPSSNTSSYFPLHPLTSFYLCLLLERGGEL